MSFPGTRSAPIVALAALLALIMLALLNTLVDPATALTVLAGGGDWGG
jgi:hypothetical protein